MSSDDHCNDLSTLIPPDLTQVPRASVAAESSATTAAWPMRRLRMGPERVWSGLFGISLAARLVYPFVNSPLDHLFSDPQRHWDNGAAFLHPGIMGCIDPFLYQLWIFGLRLASGGSAAGICLGSGLLCAAMPYGWYRALRELRPRRCALQGALLIALIPESIGLYGYFMNETLLLALLGFCFWSTLRARRKATTGAFLCAALLWIAAAFTRTFALPLAIVCIGYLWLKLPHRPRHAAAVLCLGLLFAVPAALHSEVKLRFWAPFGNLYFNEIYSVSGRREIAVDYGPEGRYHFGCPSFFNPTFYPFSAWTTARSGVVAIAIDLAQGRPAWTRERQHVAEQRTFPRWRQRLEDTLYLLFGQDWPNSDIHTLIGWLTLWSRWVWAPWIGWVVVSALQGRYRGRDRVLPACALGSILLLLLQSEGVMEARFREPVDAMLVCAALLRRSARTAQRPLEGPNVG